jgi:type IV pilus assembly protein PilF
MILRALLASLITVCLASCGGGQSSRKGESKSDAAAYNMQLGVGYLQKGNLAVAQEKLERSYKENPRDPNVHSALALLYERLNEPKKVDMHYREAVRLAPKNPEISNNYAVYLCRNGRTEEGVKRFLDAASNPLYRKPEAAFTNAGVCLRNAKKESEAEQNFLRALKVRPNYAEAAYQLGDLDFGRGRLKEARARVDGYLGAFAATPDLLLLGVRVTAALGDRLAAERYARRLRVDFPDSQQIRELPDLKSNPG